MQNSIPNNTCVLGKTDYLFAETNQQLKQIVKQYKIFFEIDCTINGTILRQGILQMLYACSLFIEIWDHLKVMVHGFKRLSTREFFPAFPLFLSFQLQSFGTNSANTKEKSHFA